MKTLQGKCNLTKILWNGDLVTSPKVARTFVEAICASSDNSLKLKELQMKNVFTKKENRDALKDLIANSRCNQLKLIMWEPDFTDDESGDYTEEDSVDDPLSDVGNDKDYVDPSHAD